MPEPAQNGKTSLSNKNILKLFLALKFAYFCCFCLGGN